MKHIGTFVAVFLILMSFSNVRADEVAAPAAEAAAAPALAPEEVEVVKAPEAPAPAPAPTEVASAPAAEATRAPASAEPAPAPEAKPAVVPSVAVSEKAVKTKKWKNNGLRKVKAACEVMDNPEGKKIGLLKLDRKLWTDETDKEGWYKVTRKTGPGFVKKECFE